MNAQLQAIVDKLSLENPRIMIGRERLYPPREGLEPSQEAINTLKQALESPTSVKSSVKIMDWDDIVFNVSNKGEVKVPYSDLERFQPVPASVIPGLDADLIREPRPVVQPEVQLQTTEVEPVAEVTEAVTESESEVAEPEAVAESPDVMDEPEVAQESESMTEPVSEETEIQDVAEAIAEPESESEPESQPETEAESVAQMDEAEDFASSESASETPEPETESERIELPFENDPEAFQDALHRVTASQYKYLDLSGRPERFEVLRERFVENPEQGVECDKQVFAAALDQKLSSNQAIFAISNGPNVQAMLDRDIPSSEINADYITPLMTAYMNEQQVEKAEVQPIPETLPPAATAEDKVAPVPPMPFSEAVKPHIESTKENLAQAQKNLSTFAKNVRHRGFKAWALEQMPKLKEQAIALATEKGTQAKAWAQEQAPIVAGAMLAATVDKGQTLKGWAIQQAPVVAGAVIGTAQVVGKQALVTGKELGAIAAQKFQDSVQVVDGAKIEQAGKDLIGIYGKNGTYSGETFNVTETPNGISFQLKDGTPVFENGKLSQGLDSKVIQRLSNIPKHVGTVKARLMERTADQSHEQQKVGAER